MPKCSIKNWKRVLLFTLFPVLIISHGERFLGGDASFYVGQVGAGATITAGLCIAAVTTVNTITGVSCIIALAYTIFASVGHYITTSSTADSTTSKRHFNIKNLEVTHLNGTGVGLAGNNSFHWYDLTNVSSPSYIGNYIPLMSAENLNSNLLVKGYVGYAYNDRLNITTVSVTTDDIFTPELHYQNKMAYYSGNTTKLLKRGWASSITWASYEYNDGNQDLWDKFPKEGDEFEYIASEFGEYVGNNVAQKYCACFGDSSTAGTSMALHGEVYFDAYGGVDSDCDANLCNTY